jgi:hypothetical protein
LTTAYTVGNTYIYFNNAGTDWQVYGKAGLDVIMTGVGFLVPIGFGISATYFILDNPTGNFWGFLLNPDYALAIFEVNFSILQALEIIDGIILRRMVLLKIYNATY